MARIKVFDENGNLTAKPVEYKKKIPKHQKEVMDVLTETLPDADERGVFIRKLLNSSMQWYKQPPCKNDDEVAERLDEYFQTCFDLGELPTIESMCLSLGISRQILRSWENGYNISKARSEMIAKAKEMIAQIDAQLVAYGKMPQVTYIFRAKNYYGMTDKTDLQVTTRNQFEDFDEEQIRQHIRDTIVVDEE